MSSAIGEPPLRIEPETCTELALSASTLAPATISVGVLAVTPLPSDELPQPAITSARSTSARRGPPGDVGRACIDAQTLAVGLAGLRQLGCRATMASNGA